MIENSLIEAAKNGDSQAIEQLVLGIKDMVYNVSLRMLFSPFDAEDATQEILIKVIQNIESFQGRSKFTTWVYRVAVNYLINERNKKEEPISFEMMESSLKLDQNELAQYQAFSSESDLLVAELKIGCTQAMLLCLDKEKRLMYILSKIFEIPSEECAKIFDISPAAYRKRISRITERMKSFLTNNCGLVNKECVCQCKNRTGYAIANKRVNPDQYLFVQYGYDQRDIGHITKQIGTLEHEIFQNNPMYVAPQTLIKNIVSSIEKKQLEIF